MATQTKVIEAIADPDGALLPSVPVISIVPYNPDDVWRVLAVVLAPSTSAWAATQYLGAGLTSTAIKLSATQVRTLPLPCGSWDDGADLVRQGQLDAFATVMNAHYDVPTQPVTGWWQARRRSAHQPTSPEAEVCTPDEVGRGCQARQTERVTPELALGHRMADAADALTMALYQSPDLAVETKSDGTPVTEVDRAVEAAMKKLVLEERPGDAFLGEEIGPSGSGAVRWIFDGIDGTHNYAAGRPGWGTMLALEIEGEVVASVISSPAVNQRWWAQRGHGSWTGNRGAQGMENIERLVCRSGIALANASVLASPSEGFLEGWRSVVAARLGQDVENPRNFAWAGSLVAEGKHDATVILAGGVWDLAANVVIVEEAGGCFVNLWNHRRLDTTTAVYGSASLVADIVAAVADLVPAEPDAIVRARPPMPR